MSTIIYIKTHNKTGLKYFGKTTKNPYKYKGSGKYWKKHLKIHGDDIKTEVIKIFDDENECEEFCMEFSILNDIIKSKEWANLINENGKDGAPVGNKRDSLTKETKDKISKSSKSRWECKEYKDKLIKIHKERWLNAPELKKNQSDRLMGIKRPEHSKTMLGRTPSEKTKEKMRKPKKAGHGENVSKALKGKCKSLQHRKAISASKLGKSFVTQRIFDHIGNIFNNKKQFSKFYNINVSFFDNLNSPIRYKGVYDKLNIPYTPENRLMSKKQLGFKIEQKGV